MVRPFHGFDARTGLEVLDGGTVISKTYEIRRRKNVPHPYYAIEVFADWVMCFKMLAGVGGQHPMARPYSQDLRDRVVGSVASGRTCRATAVLFGVSVASVVKWSQRWRASGRTAAKPMGGRRPLRLQRERGWLLARIAEKPDLTPACVFCLGRLARQHAIVASYRMAEAGVAARRGAARPGSPQGGPARRRRDRREFDGAARGRCLWTHRGERPDDATTPVPQAAPGERSLMCRSMDLT